MPEPTTLAEWLRQEMRNRHITSARLLASKAGLSHDTVSRALLGVRPELTTIEKFSTYFKEPRDHLLFLAGYLEAPADQSRSRSDSPEWPMLAPTKEHEMLALFRELTERDQYELLELARTRLDLQRERDERERSVS